MILRDPWRARGPAAGILSRHRRPPRDAFLGGGVAGGPGGTHAAEQIKDDDNIIYYNKILIRWRTTGPEVLDNRSGVHARGFRPRNSGSGGVVRTCVFQATTPSPGGTPAVSEVLVSHHTGPSRVRPSIFPRARPTTPSPVAVSVLFKVPAWQVLCVRVWRVVGIYTVRSIVAIILLKTETRRTEEQTFEIWCYWKLQKIRWTEWMDR